MTMGNICYVVAAIYCLIYVIHGHSINSTDAAQSNETVTAIAIDEDTGDYDSVTDVYDELGANATDGIQARLTLSATAGVITDFPYMVHISSVTSSGTRLCSGALVTAEFVITAASCVEDASVSTVNAGAINGAGTVRTGSAIVHPKYYTHPQEYDIALLRLDVAYAFTDSIAIIKIAPKSYTDDYKDLAGKTMRVASYGNLGLVPPILAFQLMAVIPRKTCLATLRTRRINLGLNQDCLNTYNGLRGGCNPLDKGAAVTHRFNTDTEFSLVGILTYFEACVSGTPNVFTRIGPVWDLLRKYVPILVNTGK